MDMTVLAANGQAVVGAGIVLGLILLFVVFVIILIVAKLMVVGNPSEMLIISGKRQREGQGYRTLIGGRTLVIPRPGTAARIRTHHLSPFLLPAEAADYGHYTY